MSNQFYEYIGSQLVAFFEQESEKEKSNRYYLHLPSNEHVTELYNVLKDRNESKVFPYQHREGSEIYETIAFKFGGMTYIIATTDSTTTIDFLVTLRNEMSEQKGQWKNTSLLFISNTLNDSIRGGSIDITSEGFPLHVRELVGNLDEIVQQSAIPSSEKELIRHYLKNRLSEYEIENASFLDFEDILAILNKSEMSQMDYFSLHYFPDEKLYEMIKERDSFPYESRDWNTLQRTINDRLSKNNMQHEEIDSIRSLGNAEERLVEKFDNGGETLKDEHWYTVDFEKIQKWEEKVKATQDIAFTPEKVKVTLQAEDDTEKNMQLDHWQRPKAMTSAGQRNWNFIVFYPNYQAGEEVQITLPFDRHTSKKFLNSTSVKTTLSKGHSLVTTLKLEKAGATFQRVAYKHEHAGKSNFVFNIAVIGWEQDVFKRQSDSYLVKTSPKRQQAIQFTLDNSTLMLGEDKSESIELTPNQHVIEMNKGAEISFGSGILEEGETSLRFILKNSENELPIEIKDEKLQRIPIASRKLWELKRTKQSSFYIDESLGRVEIDHLPYSTYEKDRPFFRMELEWLENRLRQASLSYEQLVPEECALPDKLADVYDSFLNAISGTGTIPSLLYYSVDVREKADAYIMAYIEEIEAIEENQVMTAKQRSLFYLGTIRDNYKIYMTPFSPLNVVYQLELNKESKGETIDPNILQRLNAAFTLPYLVDQKGALYKPTTDHPLPEWHTYLPQQNVTVGETNLYLAKVIQEKLDQFISHYDYLFQIDDTAPILLNVIHIPNDVEILRGIIDWIKAEIKKKNSLSGIRNIEITTYSHHADKTSVFDIFNNASEASELKKRFNFSFGVKEIPENDVLHTIQGVLHYTKRKNDEAVKYAHITFYKMKGAERVVRQVVSEMPSSLNLNGLFTTNVFKKEEDQGYRVGFGIGESEYTRTLLTHFVTKVNELAMNMRNKGQDPYQKNSAIAIHSDKEDQGYLDTLYEQSNWLTFIDPVVDLKYFENTSKNLVVVHYSDQYSPSSYYDAITVTNKTDQYHYVIDEFLKSQNVKANDEQIESIIRTFNTFNGEWLLRAVQNRAHDKREKMSIVSAIKLALNFFDKSDILWVPLSMEEVVRVTGSVKLSRKTGLFSRKSGSTGQCSDDLLMMGLEQMEGELYVHMYPVEVKIGNNSTSVIDKGIKQVHELKRRLNEHLLDDSSFDAKFFRNFFIRLFINNVAKMDQNCIWPERNYTLEPSVIDKLLNDDFQIVDSLQADYGSGLIISFGKNTSMPVHERSQGVIILEYPEQYGYQALPLPVSDLDNQLTNEHIVNQEPVPNKNVKDISTNSDDASESSERKSQEENKTFVVEDEEDGEPLIDYEQSGDLDNSIIKNNEQNNNLSEDNAEKPMQSEVRPLIGVTNNMPVHWEFNHSSLSNRHLVIGGRSGQGKTYFIQALLQDLAKTNQSAVVIDYSSSYTPGQLDPVFVEKMASKLKERIVYNEGFPLNPFLLREKEVSSITFEEKPAEAARRVVDVFASVYRTFGPQQKAALYDATKRGIEKYEKKMTMELLLEELGALENYSNQVVMSISSRLMQFVHIDPFDYDIESQWDEYFAPGGNVTIIQLAGYDQDEIKRLLAEFILWDLWYYTQDRTKDQAIPVILDEAQNLDFSDGSPAAKILREGRKFGWSAWFATQTFNNFTKNELSIIDNAGTKVYFNPVETEIRVISNRIGEASTDELRMLKKGQCLVIGQFAQADDNLGTPTYHVINVPPMDGKDRK